MILVIQDKDIHLTELSYINIFVGNEIITFFLTKH